MEMLKPAKMKKARIYALKSKLSAVIKSLHEAGFMEIRKFRIEGLESGRPLEFFDEVSTQLVRLRNILSNMDKDVVKSTKAVTPSLDGKTVVKEAERLHSEIGKRLRDIANEINNATEDISRAESQLRLVERLEVFKGMDFADLSSKSITYVIGEVPLAKRASLKRKIESARGKFSVLSPEGSKLVLIIYSRDSPPIESILTESGFSSIQVPEGMRTPEAEISKLKHYIQERKKTLKELENERKALSEKYVKKTFELMDVLNIESERAEISSRFAFSDRMSVMEGWIKADNLDRLKDKIAAFGDDAVLEEIPIEEHEHPPIILENPRLPRPFEYITKSYSMPHYFELDPTFIYFIGLPIIYGMIVGDVLYGVLSIFIASFFLKKFKDSYVMSNVARIWYYSSIFAIIFGIMFDEWGGMSHIGWFELLGSWGLTIITSPVYSGLFSRLHHFPLLLGVTLLVGLIHLGVGFLLGAYNLWEHHRKHAYAKLAWLGVEIGGAVAVASIFLGLLPEAFATPALGIFGLSVIALILTEGAIGALEIPGLAGNVLSYARIAAVGVVGVVLAEIINEVLMPVPEAGILVILFIPLLLILHAINTFIAMFEALIQGGRLNVIEFRSKFLEGGGVLFDPFALKKR
jgi:V/A-type H+-transporting ATPase subunit I